VRAGGHLTGDRDLFGRARKAAAASAEAKAIAEAAQAKAEADRRRQEREQLVHAAIRYSRQVLQLNYEPDWRASGPDAAAQFFAETIISGLRWKYYGPPRPGIMRSETLRVFHPKPPCGHGHEKSEAVENLAELARLFDRNGKPIESAWQAVRCLECDPPGYGDSYPPGFY
jgi:hypothetical protein